MALVSSTYTVAPKGMATSFTDVSLPEEFAQVYKNRFRNADGGAEKRQGLVQFGNTVTGLPSLTNIHELVTKTGTTIQFVSGGGVIYKHNETTDDWESVYTFTNTANKIFSSQYDEKLIFHNAADRNMWTSDGTTFTQLKALSERGTVSSESTAKGLYDADVSAWSGVDTIYVTDNDILYNIDMDAYAVITNVDTSSLSHTEIGTGGTGIGYSTATVAASQRYEIYDAIELNIFPTTDPNFYDNTAVAASGSDTTTISVSGVDFNNTEIRVGDWIRNSTKTALTEVTAVATSLGVVGVSGQSHGDSLIFLKSALPIAKSSHVNYGRLYLVDARDERKVRISGDGDPQDFTRDYAQLDAANYPIGVDLYGTHQSMNIGSLQPVGDTLLGITTWQRFLFLVGKKNIYAYAGTIPIGSSADITPAGLFPQGCIGSQAYISYGNELLFVSPTGLEGIGFAEDNSSLTAGGKSDQIDTSLREQIKNSSPEDVSLTFYPRRNWIMFKIGSEIWVYNFADVTYSRGTKKFGSWHLFDGPFAQMNAYQVLRDGTLACVGNNGIVAKFDQNTFDDLGTTYDTEYKTGWLTMIDPKTDIRTKIGKYLRAYADVGDTIDYNVKVEAPFDASRIDTATISATAASAPIGLAKVGVSRIGGSGVTNQKVPLRWRGERARFTFTTNDSKGPDVLSKFAIYFNFHGRE